jgi:hypothetical protein
MTFIVPKAALDKDGRKLNIVEGMKIKYDPCHGGFRLCASDDTPYRVLLENDHVQFAWVPGMFSSTDAAASRIARECAGLSARIEPIDPKGHESSQTWILTALA